MSDSGNSTGRNVDGRVDLISTELLTIFNTVNLAVLAGAVALCGCISNILNIVVFLKQGFKDTVNIGLFGLAISDLCSLLTLEWITILNNPLFINNVPMVLVDVQHLTAAWPHACFARITSWITVYITLERCLCVAVPLKIKSIITPRVTVCVLVSIFVFMFLTVVPEYATCYMDWKFVPDKNRSMLVLFFLDGRDKMAALSFNISVGTQIISFGSVIVFTAILVFKMQKKSKWRKKCTSSCSDSSNEANSRNKRTVKMITTVAVIYCICFLPMLCAFIAISIESEFIVFGAFNNSFFLVWSFAFLMESMNSSVNVFVYYRMSSKYRTMFDLVVFRREAKII